ncbi:MAG: NUDIX domain-containing protein [Lactobacillales bacterium]|jgi:mutator protein MutT|nr:NUDIX domain-containing protein [Lactobacillales bacterium]
MENTEDLRFGTNLYQFDIRAAGFLINAKTQEVVLSHEVDDSLTIPGGAVKLGETTEEAVVREFHEELGISVEVVRLLAVIENFWTENESVHQQIFFCYLVRSEDYEIKETPENTEPYWEKLSNVHHLKPDALNELLETLPISIKHIVSNEDF